MLNDFWKQFKSGTDIRGVAVPGAGYDVNLTDETVTAMVNGFILWLSEKTGMTPQALSTTLNGERNLDIEEYTKICDALGVRYDYFFNKRAQNKPA